MIRRLKVLHGDRRRRQRGSVLSGLLIIVAFLSILIGALMTELTTSFLISRTHTARVAREATATSAMELAINRFQNRMVPTRCVNDHPDLVPLTLNGSSAAGTSSCTGIVPDRVRLAGGAFAVDGTHVTLPTLNSYLVGDQAGNLRSYSFGQSSPAWTIAVGGALTAPPLAKADPFDNSAIGVLVPTNAGGGCGGHCVELFEYEYGNIAFRCAMPTNSTVRARPTAEQTDGGRGNFPAYAFFGDTAGNLYVYDAYTEGACPLRKSTAGQDPGPLGGAVVGDLLVFPGSTSTSDEIFALVAGSGTTRLVHWRYSEVTDRTGITTITLVQAESTLSIAVGSAAGYAISSTVPTVGSRLTLAVTGTAGNLALATITVGSGPSYSMSGGSAAPLVVGGVSRAPYWCRCPDGQDLIGVGSSNGTLYVLDSGLNLMWSYSGVADGSPAINTTPAADANGNWYFGANDGYVYNVEPPPSGQQMFKAARIFAGSAISSSPVVGSDADGCARDPRLNGQTPCVYFASSTSGVWFAKIGSTRVLDVRVSCVTVGTDLTTCVNPRLWAQIEVGYGVKVRGWSYYAP